MNCNRKQEIEKKISLLEKELALIKKQELEEKIGKNYKLDNHTYFKVKNILKEEKAAVGVIVSVAPGVSYARIENNHYEYLCVLENEIPKSEFDKVINIAINYLELDF